MKTHKLLVLILSFIGFGLNAQIGSVNILAEDGQSYLVPLCEITYIFETTDGRAQILIRNGEDVNFLDVGNQLITSTSYDAIIASTCTYIKEFSANGVIETSGRSAVGLCNISLMQEYGSDQALGVAISDGRRINFVDPYSDLINDLLCINKPPSDPSDVFAVDLDLFGTDLLLTMNNGTIHSVDLTDEFEDNYVTGGSINNDCELVLIFSDGPNLTIPFGDCAGADGEPDTDDQQIEIFQITGSQLCLSIEDDGQPTQCVDLSQTLPDPQFIDFFNFSGDELCISLSQDNVPPVCVTLDNLDIDVINDLTFDCVTNELTIDMVEGQDYSVDLSCIAAGDSEVTLECDENGLFTATVGSESATIDLNACGGVGTDDQTIDQLTLVGSVMFISLEDDGEPPLQLDLSDLIGGESSDNQQIQTFNLDCVTGELSIELEDGGGVQTVDLSTCFGGDMGPDVYVVNGSCSDGLVQLLLSDASTVTTSIPCGDEFIDTDDQTLNANWNCTSGILTLELEDDPNGIEIIDMSCVVNTDPGTYIADLECNDSEIDIILTNGAIIETDVACTNGVDLVIDDLNCVDGFIEITTTQPATILTTVPCDVSTELHVVSMACVNDVIEFTMNDASVVITTVPCEEADGVIADIDCVSDVLEIELADGSTITTTVPCGAAVGNDGYLQGVTCTDPSTVVFDLLTAPDITVDLSCVADAYSWDFAAFNAGSQSGLTQTMTNGETLSFETESETVLGLVTGPGNTLNIEMVPGAEGQVIGVSGGVADWVDVDDYIAWGDIDITCAAGVVTFTWPDGSTEVEDLNACGLGGGGGADGVISDLNCNGGFIEIVLADMSTVLTSVTCGMTDTDDQCLNGSLNGSNLELGIDDCPTDITIDLSSLDTDTDDQCLNASFSAGSNQLTIGIDDCPTDVTVDLSDLQDDVMVTSLNPTNLVVTEPTDNQFQVNFVCPPCSGAVPAGALCYEACDGQFIVIVQQ